MKNKICGHCKEVKSVSEFCKDRHSNTGLRSACKACDKISRRKYNVNPKNRKRKIQRILQRRKENPDLYKKYMRMYQLKSKYDMSLDEYDGLFELQKGLCAICGREQIETGRLQVDHSHKTGKIRGLLCIYCNTRLGWYEKQKENIKDYLGE